MLAPAGQVAHARVTGRMSPVQPRPGTARLDGAHGRSQRAARSPLPQPGPRGLCAQPPRAQHSPPAAVDVAVIGGGVIGLASALALLRHPDAPTVALVEAEPTTAGGGGGPARTATPLPPPLPFGGRATGAGQGYLWLAHRDPGSALWSAAAQSKDLWAEWAAGGGIFAPAEHRETGSLLLAPGPRGEAACAARAARLASAGVDGVTALSAADLARLEPALAAFPPGGGAVRVAGDAQINGRGAAAALLDGCRAAGAGRRFIEAAGAPAVGITAGDDDDASAFNTVHLADGRSLTAGRGVLVAAGAWSGALLAATLERGANASAASSAWRAALAPRRGHLLVLPRPASMPALNHGMMEAGYTKHYSGSDGGGGGADLPGLDPAEDEKWGVVFTATTAADGALLIGSSREDRDDFTGHAPCPEAVAAMLRRAAAFLPGLGGVEVGSGASRTEVLRVGLRPAMVASSSAGPPPPPAIGRVAPGLYVSAGHEGSGLTMAPVSARLIASLVMDGRPGKEDAGWAGEVDPGKVVERWA